MRSVRQVVRDFGFVLNHIRRGDRFHIGLSSVGLLRPDLSLPAYAGFIPDDGVAPVFNFFDRTGGGRDWKAAVTRNHMRDWRGGRLSYDEHDGTDFVCPAGTPLVAAAPGRVVATRDNWLRGGLTLCVDHGEGVVTQYTHLTRALVPVGHKVERGEPVALSGHSGLDLAQFFPWVPPHVHFMVWVAGQPVDPYLAAGESARAGSWLDGNDPATVSGRADGDPPPASFSDLAVHGENVRRLVALCREKRIVEEVERLPDDLARVAILEDSLHHDRPAWPAEARGLALRPPGRPDRVRLTLPLPTSHYVRARAADMRGTRPPGESDRGPH
jgi:murein DD-endopeptidase MepM/ murein hydrolase activator NlpD